MEVPDDGIHTLIYGTDLAQRHTHLHSRICSWLNNFPKGGVAPVLLADITEHTQGCTLTSETGATPPPLQLLSLEQTHEHELHRLVSRLVTVASEVVSE